MRSLSLVLLAGGSGQRFLADNKLLVMLEGKSVFYHSATRLLTAFPNADRLLIVAPEAWQPTYAALLSEAITASGSPLSLADCHWVASGCERWDSVWQALQCVCQTAPAPEEIILIHDAARPLLPIAASQALLARLEQEPQWAGGSVATPLTDSLKRSDAEGGIAESVDRAGLWQVQTPQAFRWQPLLKAHQAYHTARSRSDAALAITDDCQMLEVFLPEAKVWLQTAPKSNLKLTTVEDVALAAALLGLEAS